jgi:hypothetical protein
VRRALAFVVLAAALPLLPAGGAAAATLQVTTTAESGAGSLGETILEAGPGDTIRLGPGEFPLTNGETLIEQRNELVGAGANRTTIVPTGGGEALVGISVTGATVAEARNPDDTSNPVLDTKVQVVALIATLALFLVVLDLVRRRRLAERYALLWMGVSIALLVLAIWRNGLDVIADLMGVEQPANAIFILAIGAGFVLLLHFSVATTRLSEETKILAQESARLEQELRAARGELAATNGDSAAAEHDEHEPPVGTQGSA